MKRLQIILAAALTMLLSAQAFALVPDDDPELESALA